MLKLTFLGRGAAFYPRFGNTNAWFEEGKSLFFLDFGEEAFHKVATSLRLEAYDQIYVLLTHLHADHAGSLASLCSYTHCVLGKQITIVHPLDTVVKMLSLQGIAGNFYTWRTELPSDCTVKVRFVEVRHAEDMRAFGLVLSDAEETVYYSGDSADLPEEIAGAYLEGSIARIYHDTASHEGPCHCCYKRLEERIPPDRRRNVFCMHLDGDYAGLLREHGFSVVEVDHARGD